MSNDVLNQFEQLFADAGVMAIEHADFEGGDFNLIFIICFHSVTELN